LLVDDVVHLGAEPLDVFDREIGSLNRVMDHDVGVTFVEELRPRWPNLPRAGDRHRYNRQSRRDRHPERTLLERVQSTVAAASTFGEDDEGIAILLGLSHTLVDGRIRRRPRPTIDLDHSGDLERLGEHRDLVELGLCEIADRGGDGPEQKRHVEVREVIGQEKILGVGLDMLGAADRVAHRWDPEEYPAPQLHDELASPAQPQGHHKDE